MEFSNLEDKQNSLNLASVFQRACAVIIDFIIVIFIVFILFITYKFIHPELFPMRDEYNNIIFNIIKMFYVAAFLYILQGQTLGKKLMNIRVIDYGFVNENDKNIKIGQIFLRLFGEFLTILTLYAGYLIILFRKDKRGLHDLIAGTVVVYEPKSIF